MDNRRKQLAMIHLAKKELGLSDDSYREIIKKVCEGMETSAKLDEPNRRKLLAFFRGMGWGKIDATKGRPHNMQDEIRGGRLRKIEALLAEAKRPWSYADILAKKIAKVDRIAFCKPIELGKIISALVKDAQRNGRRTA